MSNRFTDNVTPLDAYTLNKFEEDVKNIPIYNAVYEETSGGFRNYRIADVEWNDIPAGAVFAVSFNTPTQGATNEIISIRFKTGGGKFLFYGNLDTPLLTSKSAYVKVNNRKYLTANRPYLIKKRHTETGSSIDAMLVLIEQYDTGMLGAALEANANTLHLKNMDGVSISNVSVASLGAELPGQLKVGTTTYILRTGTSGASGYITFVLE